MPVNPDTTLTADWSFEDPEFVDTGPLAVDEADLMAWLSAQFQTYPGCAAVSVECVFRLSEPDSHGCNWSRTLFLDSGGASPLDYAPAYAAIVDMARKAFNLKPPAGSDYVGVRTAAGGTTGLSPAPSPLRNSQPSSAER